jgi:pimeloyl-ACP methyl ester carboxylesterase
MGHLEFYHETVSTRTSDGWMLHLSHYLPAQMNVSRYPVILCHGLAANKNSCDYGAPGSSDWERYSLAAYLVQPPVKAGMAFDVWVPELRGNGEQPSFDPRKHPEKYRWTVDDYIDKDVPAIIRCIQGWYQEKKQEIPPVFWVGKSMGGMIAYAYGETKAGQKNLKGVVTLGSPVVFGKTGVLLEFLSRVTPRNVSIPIRIADLLEKSGELAMHFMDMGVNPENVDPEVLRNYMRIGFSTVLSSKVLSQFSLFFKHTTFCRYPRYPWMYDFFGRVPGLTNVFTPYSYTENLYRFTAPLLLIAGGLDKLAPKTDMAYVQEHVGSTDVTYLEFSKEAGYQADYGHLDLNLGFHTRDEVYPAIYNWLVHQATLSKE